MERVILERGSYAGGKLPGRAKHFAEKGDVYISSVWGSVGKWCLVGNDNLDYVVTNGCHRFRVKNGKEEVISDLVSFLCTDCFATQMRALARGSDGLAEITVDDAKEILVPKIKDAKTREMLKPFVKNLLFGKPSLSSTVDALLNDGKLKIPLPEKRPNHAVLV